MATIPGASQFLNSSTLANSKGTAPSINNIFTSRSDSLASVLQAGRNALAVKGIGISPGARSLNEDFLNRADSINQMFSLGVGSGATLDGLAQEILAIRSRLNDTQLAPSLRGQSVDTTDSDGKNISASQKVLGRNVSTTA